MIRAIEIHGFRSLRSVRLELGRLNVLVGPNQSGKTNVLDALSFLASAVNGRLSESVFKRRGGLSNLLWMGEGEREIKFAVEFVFQTPATSAEAVYEFVLEETAGGYVVSHESFMADGQNLLKRDRLGMSYFNVPLKQRRTAPLPEEGTEELFFAGMRQGIVLLDESYGHAAHALSAVVTYPGFDVRARWASTDIRDVASMRQPQFVENATTLSPLGDNLVNVLYTLSQGGGRPRGSTNGAPPRDRWREFKDAVRVGFPDFEDIVFPADAGMGRISFAWLDRRFPGQRFPAEILSDGTLCFLALTAAVMSPGIPALTAIDEPEMHLHPELLYRLVGILEQASAERQIIVTTHSDALLSYLSDPSSIVLVDNGPEGTTLTRPDEEALAEWMKDYTLGELREAGHLKAFAAGRDAK